MAYSKDGNAGAIRDAGGAFGKMETAEEARYFNKLVTQFFTYGILSQMSLYGS